MKLKVIKEIIIENSVCQIKRYLKCGEIFNLKSSKNGLMIKVDDLLISPYDLDKNSIKFIH